MAYNNVPLANQRISDSQPLIQSNFQQIQTTISVDHVPIADVSGNQGFHNKLTMPQQSVAPAGLAATNLLYSLVLAGTNELYINKNNGTPIPMTASLNAAPGWAYLPSGILHQWGTFSNPVGGTVTFPIAFPNACLIVLTSSAGAVANTVIRITGVLTKTTFTCSASNALDNVGFYLAIGY